MNTFTLGACFQHELHMGPYFMTFAPRLYKSNIEECFQSGTMTKIASFLSKPF